MLDGVLFFPVTPFTESGEVDLSKLAEHVATGVDAGPGGVFIACGTGEFHALETGEFAGIVRTAVEATTGRVPVYAGAGGSVAQAKPGILEICDGAVAVPSTPGLGIEIDDDALGALHEQYVRCAIRDRDDTGYMQSIDPGFRAVSPRW